ncbi:hypothetical protein MIND_01406800 [Mycena indigotica]|uniref:F-box domain-containing protein n=1 Tax=Mycena indigotica TaxID=2126181 RepID=A0A8H6RYB7_9AGAR|nr:uncharacterized protein MIND_01406800 [Mycena indigotica]KAF7288908.1 hypothetical protein MIND_01406800 [Mycena indigotica]
MTTTPAAFPNELLLKIFADLPPSDVHSVALCSQLLRALACEFVFATFHFTPYAFDSETRVLRGPTGYQKEDLLDKLAFFASESIAPHVTSIVLNRLQRKPGLADPPYKRSPFESPFAGDEATHALLLPFFATLDAFRKVHTLRVERVTFTALAVEALAQLRGLHTFTAITSSCTAGLRCSPPTLLVGVKLTGTRFTDITLTALPVFPHVTTLALPLDCRPRQSVLPQLNTAFPAVESLVVDGYGGSGWPAPAADPAMLPRLSKLDIHDAGAAPFLAAAAGPVTQLTVRWSQALALRNSLAAVPPAQLATVTSLELQLENCKRPTFAALCGCFPALEDFKAALHVSHKDHTHADTEAILALVAAIPDFLPRGLRRLRLYYMDSEADEPAENFVVPDPRTLFTQLRTRCAALSAVELMVPFLALEWDGVVEPNGLSQHA